MKGEKKDNDLGAGLHSMSCHDMASHRSHDMHEFYAAMPIFINGRFALMKLRARPVVGVTPRRYRQNFTW